MKLAIRLLGAAQLHHTEQEIVGPASTKGRALLYYLVMTQRAHTRTHLANLLWSEYPEEAARANLRKALSELDECIGDFLLLERQTVALRSADHVWVDAKEFAMHLSMATTDEAATPLTQMQQALDLYQGDFLTGFYVRQAPDFETWMLGERARLRQLMVNALKMVAVYLANQGDLPRAIAYARKLLEQEPWQEEIHRYLMTWLAEDGQRTTALAQYEICRRLLAQELDVAPSQATEQLYARLQRQERAPAVLQRLTSVEYPLVGRQAEWQTLQALWKQALLRGAHFVTIAGEAGLGKTRLAEELLMMAQRQGYGTTGARTYPLSARLAYGAVASWLRSEVLQARLALLEPLWLGELVRLLPELRVTYPDLPQPAPLADRWQQKHFFDALTYAFTADERPLLLVLDDLQWCDEESLEWLTYLLGSSARAKLLVVATVRLEEAGATHPLHKVWRTLLRNGQHTTIELTALSAPETAILAGAVAQQALSEQTAVQLYQETGGNPLFVIERMRILPEKLADAHAGERRAAAHASLNGSAFSAALLSPKVVALLQARLEPLSAPTYALAQLAACVGRAFRLDLLVEASRHEQEVVAAGLEELWQRHLVQEVGIGVYDFCHEHIRTVASGALSPMRYRLWHQRIAEALEMLYANNLAPVLAEVGYHYEEAGLLEQAVRYYRQAARAAQLLYAHAEVVRLLERALAVLHLLPGQVQAINTEIDLLHELGVALIRSAGWGSAPVGSVWQQAHALAQQAGTPFQQCRALLALDSYRRHRGEWQQACEQSAAALALAQRHKLTDPFLLHNLLGGHGVARYHIGQPAGALDYLERALALSQQPIEPSFAWFATHPQLMALLRSAHCLWLLGFGDQARARIQAAVEEEQMFELDQHAGFAPRLNLLDFSAMLYVSLGDVPAVQDLGDELIALASQHNFAYFLRAGRMYTGWALAQQGDVEVGLQLVRESVEVLREQGVRMFEPFWRALLAEVLALAGHYERALQEVDDVLAYAAQSANRYWDAHLLRQRGDFLQALAMPALEVEQSYRQALDTAREQGGRALELAAATALCRLWQEQGRSSEARTLLAAVVANFSEGFDTPAFRAAKALLGEPEGDSSLRSE